VRIAVVGEALGDEPAHACLARRGQQRVGALGPKLVRRREGAVEAPAETGIGQGSCLVDDRVGPGVEYGLANRGLI
jgi:hypothetical protein